jgi:hypothetical protein
MPELTVKVKKAIPVKYLHAKCEVRGWDSPTVNGVEDTEGDLIPCRNGDMWCPVIDLDTGKIEGWPEATVADVHYKICDCGTYTLLDANREAVAKAEGYVIEMMCPEPNGYGDYVIMKIGPDGTIANWAADFKEFENADDDD